MSEDAGDAGEFDDYADERDVNDWLEMFWGSLLLVIGLKQLIDPGTLLATPTMQWLGAGVVALGLAWIGHGLKDMAVKEIRQSLGGVAASTRRTVDYGLIRDVLLHPDQYGKFLLEAYRVAYEDGVLTDEELGDLSTLTEMLDIPPRDAARIATRAAINCAVEDGVVTVAEMALIEGAMEGAGLTDDNKQLIRDALNDGVIDEDEKKTLDEILGKI